MSEPLLLTPGPVWLHPKIREAMSKQIIYHRGREIEELISGLVSYIKKNMNCQDAFVLTGSGTTGWEFAFANLCKKDEKILCLSNGHFGEKLAKAASYFGNVIGYNLEANKGWSLERAKEKIDEASDATLFAMVYNETSTGVANHAKDVFSYAKNKGMITICDAISAWGAMELDMQSFGIDFCISASQKALGASPGLAIVGVSQEAMERALSNKSTSYYLDMKIHAENMKKFQTPNTPAISLMYGLQAAFELCEERGGMSANIERHRRGGEMARRFVKDIGYEVFAEEGFYSNTITAFLLENADEVRRKLYEERNIVTARDFGAYRGRLFRICHIGNFTEVDLGKAFEAIREILGR
ncbi:MAG: alanine--glyoxylate aminotransferase family protein [Candidatus Anstonellales archaeon]